MSYTDDKIDTWIILNPIWEGVGWDQNSTNNQHEVHTLFVEMLGREYIVY